MASNLLTVASGFHSFRKTGVTNHKNEKLEVGSMSVRNLETAFNANKDIKFVSLGGEGDLPEGVEDIAMDFEKSQGGEIESILSPVTMKLSKEFHKKKMELTNMQKVSGIMKRVVSKDNAPFLRFNKIQFLYIPLYDVSKEGGSLTLSLNDGGIDGTEEDQVIKSVRVPSNGTFLIEMVMEFYVAKRDMDKIYISIEADGVPISKRAYGMMLVGFFMQEEKLPLQVEPKESTVIQLDSIKNPKDINKRTILTGVSKEIQEGIKNKKAIMREREREQLRERKRQGKKVELIKYHSEPSNSESTDDDDLNENRVVPSAQISLTADEAKVNNMVFSMKKDIGFLDIENIMTFLDTGSAEHFIYSPMAKPTEVLKHIAGVEYVAFERVSCEVKIGEKICKLGEVNLMDQNYFGNNLLSYSRLISENHFSELITDNSNAFLKNGDKILAMLDTSSPGRMWLKNKAWKDQKDATGMKQGLGIKFVM